MESAQALIRVLDEVARLRGRALTAFRDFQANSPLRDMESVVLRAVIAAERAPTVSQIGRSLGHPRQVVQRAANFLVEHALIEARDNPSHARAKVLVPTEAGRIIQAQRDAEGLLVAQAMVGTLDAGLLEQTADGLQAIRMELQQHLREKESAVMTSTP